MSTTEHTTKVVPIGFADVKFGLTLTGDPEPLLLTMGLDILTPPWTQANTQALHDNFGGLWASLAVFADDYTFTSTTVSVATDGDPLIFVTDAPDYVGEETDPPVPQNCAYLVHKRSVFGGRRNRGRWYMPGVPEPAVGANGALLITAINGLNGALADFLVDSVTAPGNISSFSIFHSYTWTGDEDPGPPPGFPAPTAIVTLQCDPAIATQRRRLRR